MKLFNAEEIIENANKEIKPKKITNPIPHNYFGCFACGKLQARDIKTGIIL